MAVDPRERYMTVQIETASPEKLITMLYDGALRFMHQAQKHLEDQRFCEVNNCLIRAQDIICELMTSLDMDQGEIADNLYALYDYINGILIQANIKKDAGLIKQAAAMVSELRLAWIQAMASLPVQSDQTVERSAQR